MQAAWRSQPRVACCLRTHGVGSSSLLAEPLRGAGAQGRLGNETRQGEVCTWGLHGSWTYMCNYMCL